MEFEKEIDLILEELGYEHGDLGRFYKIFDIIFNFQLKIEFTHIGVHGRSMDKFVYVLKNSTDVFEFQNEEQVRTMFDNMRKILEVLEHDLKVLKEKGKLEILNGEPFN